ncbi:MAG: glycosyltransferase family 9 protein, partial [Chloroflexota bacterium]
PGFTRRRKPNLLAPYALLIREAASLRRERYDLAVVFRPDHWWGALLVSLAGIPLRVGMRTLETTPLLTHALPPTPGEPATLTSLQLARLALAAVGAAAAEVNTDPSFQVSAASRLAARNLWTRHALDGQPVVGVAPTAGAALKSWPLGRWAGLADGLIAAGAAVLLLGGPEDGPLLEAIQSRMSSTPVASAWGQSLGLSAAMYERCALLVGLDGGQAHLAAAVGTPTVRMYGPAPSDVFGPWPRREEQRVLVTRRLACVPCGHLEAPPCGATTLPACMLGLEVEDVLNAARFQLARH